MKFLSGQKWFSWTRLTCLVLTFAILFFVFRNLDTGAFLASLRRMDVRWFILAFLAYGFALWTASIRWHLALHLIHRAVHITATSRLFLVGHFFFAILFGAAGGDLAKSAVYAKWFRFALPEVIASSPLDRVFGLGGTILLATSMALVSVWNGGFANIRNLKIQWAGPWSLVVLGLIIVAGLGLLVWRPQGDGSWARILRAFRYGSGRMLVKPGVALPGLAFALISQTALTSVFAFNLRAVTQSPLPWAQLLWTFPAITIFSCMPFTVAGAGAREVAALTFLGIFGVPAGDCVAASLMTLVQKLAWAGIGGVVFFREDAVHARHLGEPLPKTISVIIPVINEAAALPKTVQLVRANPEVTEIIVVDGGSRDTTREVAGQLGCRVLTSPPGRCGQLRAGARQATGDVVLMLHADTWLPPDAGQAALNCLREPSRSKGVS